jgi:hypothetical protein
MGNWIVVATWQASTQHVEIFDLQTKKFVKLQQMRIITTLLFLRPQMKSGRFAFNLIHPNGTGFHNVLNSSPGWINHPCFSPDSKSLLFT